MQRNVKSENLGEEYMWCGFLMLIYHYVTFEQVYVTFCLHVIDNVS